MSRFPRDLVGFRPDRARAATLLLLLYVSTRACLLARLFRNNRGGRRVGTRVNRARHVNKSRFAPPVVSQKEFRPFQLYTRPAHGIIDTTTVGRVRRSGISPSRTVGMTAQKRVVIGGVSVRRNRRNTDGQRYNTTVRPTVRRPRRTRPTDIRNRGKRIRETFLTVRISIIYNIRSYHTT